MSGAAEHDNIGQAPPELDGEAAALAFIETLYAGAPSGRWAGIMRGAAFGRGTWRTVGAELNRRALAAQAERWAAGDDVYISVGLQSKRPPPGKRGSSGDVTTLTCLWVELDGADAPDRLAALDAAIGPASIVNGSGGGLHVYWLLDRPLTRRQAIAATLAAWRARVDSIAPRGAGERVQDAARPLRVPGTWNRKPGYGAPRPVRLLRLDGRLRYSAAELAPRAPAAAPVPVAPARRARPGPIAPAAAPGEAGPLTGYGRRMLDALAAELAALTSGRRSGALVAAFKLGQSAAAHGLDARDVEQELRAALVANGYVDEHGADAARRTIADGWAAGLANPSERGTNGADDAALQEHAAAVELWTAGAYAAVLTLPPRQRPATADVVGELSRAALAAGPGCMVDGRPVVGLSRDRAACGSGRAAETCRVALARLVALGVLAKHRAGALAGYDVAGTRAIKRANVWTLLPFAGDAAAPPPLAGAPLRDALALRFGKIGAAMLRHALDAGATLTLAELAAAVGCSRPAAVEHARRLIDAGMIDGAGERRNRRGRPSPLYVAAVGSEAEAVALCCAEDADAALSGRRADDWADMTKRANTRARAMYGPKLERAQSERDRRTATRPERERRDIAAKLADARARTAERRAAARADAAAAGDYLTGPPEPPAELDAAAAAAGIGG